MDISILQTIGIFATTAAGGWLGSLLDSYASKKGENLATKEDIADITKKIEDVKAVVSGDLWTRQAAWTMKREAYAELIAVCSEHAIALAGDASARIWASSGVPLDDPRIRDLERRAAETNERFNKAYAIARIACDDKARDVLEAHWPQTIGLEGAGQVRELQSLMIVEAKRDLDLPQIHAGKPN